MSVAHGEQIGTLEEHEGAPERGINWWGMIFFIASEALIFANLIAAYLYLEIRNGSWPVPAEMTLPLINTILMGAYFLGGQIYEYSGLFGKHFTPQTSVPGEAAVSGSAFFTLTGFHGLHVTIGLIFLLIIWLRGLRGDFTAKKHWAAQAGEMYWHFVDGVWVVVFSTVYLLPLIRG